MLLNQDPKDQKFDPTNPIHVALNPAGATIWFFRLIGNVLYNLLRGISVTVEVFIRQGFGERYFSWSEFIMGMIWLGIFALGFINIPAAFGFETTGLLPKLHFFHFITLAFLIRSMYLLVYRPLFTKIDPNRMTYTRYDGTPLSRLYRLPKASDRKVRQFYEPMFIVLCGILVTLIINPQMGSWLFLSALGMAFKELVRAIQLRGVILDRIDADIVARNLADALDGIPPGDNQGVGFAGLPDDEKGREYVKKVVNPTFKAPVVEIDKESA